MMATANAGYPFGNTDYAIPPGETLRELLDEQGMTQRDFARRTDLSPKHVNQLLHGQVPLSADVAKRLEHVTGVPARMWNNLEANYRSDLQGLRALRGLAKYVQWLADLPVRDLVRRGTLPKDPHDKASRVDQMLSFFGVASVDAWEEVYAKLECAFRQSAAHDVKPGAVATWLRLGEIAARDVQCAPFNEKRLRAALTELRALTCEPPEAFGPKLQAICAARGIAVVFVAEIPGARASGVTRWLTPQKALIQLSLRYKTDDHLWFTFFHQIAHVLLHGKTDIWIEDSSSPRGGPKEAEADRFAQDLLVPRDAAADLRRLQSVAAVQDFAAGIGVAPGIVVGRLQHDKHWPPSNGNALKRRLVLADDGGPQHDGPL